MIQTILSYITVLVIASTTVMSVPINDYASEAQTQEIVRQEYVVEKGDNVTIVSRKFNVLEEELREANNLISGEKIAIGETIFIPESDWQSYEGVASWYGPGFNGKLMANGQKYDQNKISVAHRTLPLGSLVKVTNLETGESIVAPVLDRGPYVFDEKGASTREIDLSYATAKELNTVGKGLVKVRIEKADEVGDFIAKK